MHVLTYLSFFIRLLVLHVSFVLARDAFVRTNPLSITTLFVRLSVRGLAL